MRNAAGAASPSERPVGRNGKRWPLDAAFNGGSHPAAAAKEAPMIGASTNAIPMVTARPKANTATT